jgi:hypothetical protein
MMREKSVLSTEKNSLGISLSSRSENKQSQAKREPKFSSQKKQAKKIQPNMFLSSVLLG